MVYPTFRVSRSGNSRFFEPDAQGVRAVAMSLWFGCGRVRSRNQVLIGSSGSLIPVDVGKKCVVRAAIRIRLTRPASICVPVAETQGVQHIELVRLHVGRSSTSSSQDGTDLEIGPTSSVNLLVPTPTNRVRRRVTPICSPVPSRRLVPEAFRLVSSLCRMVCSPRGTAADQHQHQRPGHAGHVHRLPVAVQDQRRSLQYLGSQGCLVLPRFFKRLTGRI